LGVINIFTVMKKILLAFIIIVFALNVNAQIITTIAGNGTAGYSGDGGQATNAELNNVGNSVCDAAGNIYITDSGNNRIRKVNTSGIITTIAGTGTFGYSGDGGQATNAELNSPFAITFDAFGNLYFSETNNYVVRKINTLGIISTVAGNGTAGYSGDGGPATSAELNYPISVIFDSEGNLYMADVLNHRIRKVNTNGIITTIAGNGTGAYSGDGGQATNAEIHLPHGLTTDAVGNIYIADMDNSRIRKINTSGIITTIAGTGTFGYSGDGGQATLAELSAPVAVSFDATGNLYIADNGNNRIRKINTSGIISTIAGNGTGGYSGDGGQATAAELHFPYGETFDLAGNLYITDNLEVIRKIALNCSECAGIEQYVNNNEQVNIYPNPNNGSFVIEPSPSLTLPQGKGTLMQVYDVNGRLILSQTINGRTSIDASSLNEGVYNISLQSNEGVVNKRLVIVK
jgi:type IX secretion system substrate protein/NHL repeat-containing protein